MVTAACWEHKQEAIQVNVFENINLETSCRLDVKGSETVQALFHGILLGRAPFMFLKL